MPDHSSSGGTAAPDACPAAEHFDNARLPYRWVPGLEVRRLPETFYHTAPWIEVSHTFDWTPGPLWLYAAPGSGTWWNPGSRVVTRNMVSAVLLWRSPEQVAAAIQAQGRDNPDYLHWRLAYGETPWLEVLRRAAAGEPPFDLFAMAGELLAPLLTPPAGVDSVLLLQQMHYWPRWWDEAHDRSRYGYAPRLLLDAARGAGRASTVAARVHRVPEIVDFRVQGADKPRAFWQRRLLRGDASGRTPCEPGPAGESCLGCTRKLHVLCECAFRTRYAAGPLVKRAFVGENARACCVQWTANRSSASAGGGGGGGAGGFDAIPARELWRVRNEAYQRDRGKRSTRQADRRNRTGSAQGQARGVRREGGGRRQQRRRGKGGG